MGAIRSLQNHSNTEKREVRLDTGNLIGVPDIIREIYQVRLIIMWIRFRASYIGLVAKINLIRAISKQASFLLRRWCWVIRFFACMIQQLGLWTQKIQANVDCCYVRRRAECTSLGPGLKHPSLRSDPSLAPRRRAEALHVVFCCNKASEPSTRAATL